MDSLAVIIGIGTGVLSVFTFIGGVLAYYRSSARKEYASERDMGHLKRHYEQLVINVEQVWRRVDERHDNLERELIRISEKLEQILNKK
jgi:hypothetical protein